ncbi:PIG-L family deacetylase [Rhodoplanes serenus]|uniref:PIG-L family deacetylase n=1 Tax=Rhodoplanes serenus TaxID=200615 RepID=A0A9X4XI33_9BRAD|nr:PIG-L family deacetylase [Rhodoplanes serenus]MTW15578.1 PIG-L family deacetylase [Rhodoplanes serenus]
MSAAAPTSTPDHGTTIADALLAALAEADRASIDASHVALVVAHPDDETLTCGALLPRLSGTRVVMATDGAPRRAEAAAEHGFESPAAYAEARRRELVEALALAGVAEAQVTRLGLFDQEVALQMPALARRLAALFTEAGTRVVLTHAFEGGHPDHDAVAFAVRAAAALGGDDGVAVIEMPLYRLGLSGWLHQSFAPDPQSRVVELRLDDDDIARKRRMLAAHATQQRTLASFPLIAERFRKAVPADLTALPNSGRLIYEQHDWGMTGPRWQGLARLACRFLGVGPVL